jgi:hypothetical protein
MSKPQREKFSGAWANPAYGTDLEPPGTYSSTVSHSSSRGYCEIALVHEHRFAFYFWNKWARERGRGVRPALVTVDWHTDLCGPGSEEESSLAELDQADDSEVALFAWSQLNPLNDGHVLAAAYLGLIGDIYVLCKQDKPEEFSFEGRAGLSNVKVYHDPSELMNAVRELPAVILDVDLDYFTRSSDPCGGGERVSLVGSDKIAGLLDPHQGLIAPVLPHLVGMTIALEPEFCGGLSNAHRLLRKLNQVMFDGTLLSEDARWRSPVRGRLHG